MIQKVTLVVLNIIFCSSSFSQNLKDAVQKVNDIETNTLGILPPKQTGCEGCEDENNKIKYIGCASVSTTGLNTLIKVGFNFPIDASLVEVYEEKSGKLVCSQKKNSGLGSQSSCIHAYSKLYKAPKRSRLTYRCVATINGKKIVGTKKVSLDLYKFLDDYTGCTNIVSTKIELRSNQSGRGELKKTVPIISFTFPEDAYKVEVYNKNGRRVGVSEALDRPREVSIIDKGYRPGHKEEYFCKAFTVNEGGSKVGKRSVSFYIKGDDKSSLASKRIKLVKQQIKNATSVGHLAKKIARLNPDIVNIGETHYQKEYDSAQKELIRKLVEEGFQPDCLWRESQPNKFEEKTIEILLAEKKKTGKKAIDIIKQYRKKKLQEGVNEIGLSVYHSDEWHAFLIDNNIKTFNIDERKSNKRDAAISNYSDELLKSGKCKRAVAIFGKGHLMPQKIYLTEKRRRVFTVMQEPINGYYTTTRFYGRRYNLYNGGVAEYGDVNFSSVTIPEGPFIVETDKVDNVYISAKEHLTHNYKFKEVDAIYYVDITVDGGF